MKTEQSLTFSILFKRFCIFILIITWFIGDSDEKAPLKVFSGCLLGLGAGNLILNTGQFCRIYWVTTGLVLWLFFLILHIFLIGGKKPGKNYYALLCQGWLPSHGWDDFMTYVFSRIPCSSYSSTKGSGGFHFSWIWRWLGLSPSNLPVRSEGHATPSWTVLYVRDGCEQPWPILW